MKKPEIGKTKLRKSQLFTKFYQFLYLSFSNFLNNNLWDSACSCSFGFIFSFVPIALIILTILIGVLKVSPVILQYIYQFVDQIKDFVDLTPLVNNLVHLKSLRVADIFLAFWVIWMARKLFLSIVRGMNSIFHSHPERKGLFIQLFTFLSEFAMVMIFIAIVIGTFTFNKILTNSLQDNSLFSFLRESFPALFQTRSNIILGSVTYILLYLFSIYIYRFVSGTKPKIRTCAFYALISTLCFLAFSFVMNKFLNISNYNFVYGTISTLIILMMKVYFFFVFFLLGAQMVYVSQFFDNLLLAELYLLPSQEHLRIAQKMRRTAFRNSTSIQTDKNTARFQAGDIIYNTGDPVTTVFYLRKGKIVEEINGSSTELDEGSFFGELPVILKTPRISKATAITDCEIMEISAEIFLELVKENPNVSSAALNQLTTI